MTFKNCYSIVRKPLSFIFSILGLIILLDYFLPKSETIGLVHHSEVSVNPTWRGTNENWYSFNVDNTVIRTTKSGYHQVYDGDSVKVLRTLILGTLFCIENKDTSVPFLQAPTTFFPFFPLILLLSFPIHVFPSEKIFFLTAQPLSILLSTIISFMIVF